MLNDTGELAIIYDIPSTARAETHPVYQLCPRQWKTDDLDPVQQIQDLVVATYEMNFFHQLADSWNAQPGAWKLFPDFLHMVYANRLRPSAASPDCKDPEQVTIKFATESDTRRVA